MSSIFRRLRSNEPTLRIELEKHFQILLWLTLKALNCWRYPQRDGWVQQLDMSIQKQKTPYLKLKESCSQIRSWNGIYSIQNHSYSWIFQKSLPSFWLSRAHLAFYLWVSKTFGWAQRCLELVFGWKRWLWSRQYRQCWESVRSSRWWEWSHFNWTCPSTWLKQY